LGATRGDSAARRAGGTRDASIAALTRSGRGERSGRIKPVPIDELRALIENWRAD
jgi:hypothetical protein